MTFYCYEHDHNFFFYLCSSHCTEHFTCFCRKCGPRHRRGFHLRGNVHERISTQRFYCRMARRLVINLPSNERWKSSKSKRSEKQTKERIEKRRGKWNERKKVTWWEWGVVSKAGKMKMKFLLDNSPNSSNKSLLSLHYILFFLSECAQLAHWHR